MTSASTIEQAAGIPEPARVPTPKRRADLWYPLLAFAVVAGVVVGVSVWAHAALPLLHRRHRSGAGWVNAFNWWDGWWYTGIARRGYTTFGRHRQTPVAFFPAYPLLMRYLASSVGGPLRAGFWLTLSFGLGSAVLFHRWCLAKLGARTARIGVMVLLLYPFAFYLMGAVYGDALFLFAVLAAFLALEGDRPVLAGALGAVATATRPVGGALVIGLWLLAIERKGRANLLRRESWRPADAGLALAPLGLVAYCTFLWVRFRHPFAFLEAAGAPGWSQRPGVDTWFKVRWLRAMVKPPYFDGHHGHLLLNAAATAVAVLLLPVVFKRFGRAYGVFASIAVVGTALCTKDFVGMGRYCLAAFPCFAAAADLIAERPKLMWTFLAASGGLLLLLAELHARGTIIS